MYIIPNRFQRLWRWFIMSELVWPIYMRLFLPWPPRGWKYRTEKVTTNDGRIREIKYPWPPDTR